MFFNVQATRPLRNSEAWRYRGVGPAGRRAGRDRAGLVLCVERPAAEDAWTPTPSRIQRMVIGKFAAILAASAAFSGECSGSRRARTSMMVWLMVTVTSARQHSTARARW